MEKSNLKVLRGGLLVSPKTCKRKFVSAYVTDTRLMGVVGMYAHYKLLNGSSEVDFHQFFYLDCEDLGFENFRCMKGNDFGQLLFMEQLSITGLGGEKVEISEDELKAVLMNYAKQSLDKGLKLPPNSEDYDFLLEGDYDESAYESAFRKQCTKIKSPAHCINYFLMRLFAGDLAGAAYLRKGHFPISLFPEVKPSTLCKNSIKKFEDGYIAESLIECENDYLLIRTQLKVEEGTETDKAEYAITKFERLSFMKISAAEAAMRLSKPEFVTVFEIIGEDEMLSEILGDDKTKGEELSILDPLDDFGLERIISNLARNSMATVHENGKLFISFNSNNNHVEYPVYQLSDDVRGIYFLSDGGELILSAYSEAQIRQMENEIWHTSLADKLVAVGKYQFQDPVIYEFMESDFEYFEDFVMAISDED